MKTLNLKRMDKILQGLICPYCNKPTEHLPDTAAYNQSYGSMIYLCRDCDAYVGCHKNKPTVALGRLANAELRQAKIQAHKYFDNLWQRRIDADCTKGHARGKAYKWLRGEMNLTAELCHIGMFDVEQCNRVVEICKPFYRNII